MPVKRVRLRYPKRPERCARRGRNKTAPEVAFSVAGGTRRRGGRTISKDEKKNGLRQPRLKKRSPPGGGGGKKTTEKGKIESKCHRETRGAQIEKSAGVKKKLPLSRGKTLGSDALTKGKVFRKTAGSTMQGGYGGDRERAFSG